MGAYQKNKGRRWEQEVAKLFREVYPTTTRNAQGFGGERMGNDLRCPRFAVECKVGKRTNPKAALAQAEKDNVDQKTPVAVCKDDNQRPVALLYLDDFMELVAEAKESQARRSTVLSLMEIADALSHLASVTSPQPQVVVTPMEDIE